MQQRAGHGRTRAHDKPHPRQRSALRCRQLRPGWPPLAQRCGRRPDQGGVDRGRRIGQMRCGQRGRARDVHVGNGRGDTHGGAVERERRERGDEPVVRVDAVQRHERVAVGFDLPVPVDHALGGAGGAGGEGDRGHLVGSRQARAAADRRRMRASSARVASAPSRRGAPRRSPDLRRTGGPRHRAPAPRAGRVRTAITWSGQEPAGRVPARAAPVLRRRPR